MKKIISAALSLGVAASLTVSAASCSLDLKGGLSGDDNDEVKDSNAVIEEISEDYCSAITDVDLYKIVDMSTDEFFNQKSLWEERLDFSSRGQHDEESLTVYVAIMETLSYEIDTSSITINGDTDASVPVTFSRADWESIINNNEINGNDELLSLISGSDPIEIPLNIEFVNQNGEWLCSNTEDILAAVFDFTDETFIYNSPYTDLVTGFAWFGDNLTEELQGIYNNTALIEVHVYLNDYNVIPSDSIRCEITDGADNLITTKYDGTSATFFACDIEDYDDIIIPAGSYTFTFYDPDGIQIISVTATVINDDSAFVYEDMHVWYYTDNIDEHGWNDYAPIYVAPDTIEAEMRCTPNNWNFDGYYTIEYEGEEIYTESGYDRASVSVGASPDLPLDESGQHFAPGEYTISFYSADGELLSTDSCTVVAEGTFMVADHFSWGFNEWDYDNDQAYFDHTGIMQCDLSYVGELDESTVSFSLFYEGEEIWSLTGQTSIIGSTSGPNAIPGIGYMDAYFDDGTYTFIFYDADGNILHSESCYVINGNG